MDFKHRLRTSNPRCQIWPLKFPNVGSFLNFCLYIGISTRNSNSFLGKMSCPSGKSGYLSKFLGITTLFDIWSGVRHRALQAKWSHTLCLSSSCSSLHHVDIRDKTESYGLSAVWISGIKPNRLDITRKVMRLSFFCILLFIGQRFWMKWFSIWGKAPYLWETAVRNFCGDRQLLRASRSTIISR